jgi:hypothetical protein
VDEVQPDPHVWQDDVMLDVAHPLRLSPRGGGGPRRRSGWRRWGSGRRGSS